MGEVIQLQGDQRKNMQEFLTDKEDGLELDPKTIKVCVLPPHMLCWLSVLTSRPGPRLLRAWYGIVHSVAPQGATGAWSWRDPMRRGAWPAKRA